MVPQYQPPPPVPQHHYVAYTELNWKSYIDALDEQNLRHILTYAVLQPALVQDLVYRYGSSAIRAEEECPLQDLQRVVDFYHLSRRAWHVLNSGCSSGKDGYEGSFEARFRVIEIIDSIRKGAGVNCTFGTRNSALENLRKIGKSIVLTDDTLGSEVRKGFQCEDFLRDGMYEILKTMDVLERQQMAEATDKKGSFLDKVIWLNDELSRYCMPGLDDVVKTMEDALEDTGLTRMLIPAVGDGRWIGGEFGPVRRRKKHRFCHHSVKSLSQYSREFALWT